MYSENPMDLVYDCFPRSKPHSIECIMDPKYFDLDGDATEVYDSGIFIINISIIRFMASYLELEKQS